MSLSTAPRHFVRPPGAAAGAPPPLAATGRPLHWAVVATGGIAATVTADIALLEDSVLHAVSSRSAVKAADFAERFGFAASYSDSTNSDGTDGASGFEAMFADPAVDIVYVATPHAQHYEVTKSALEHGKHVLCEKPFTVNAAEAAELVTLARERNLFLMEALWTRFLPSANRAWDVLASGELGTPAWVQADLGFPAPEDPASRLWDPAAGGGALLDLSVYTLTWAMGALGFPDGVTASGVLNRSGVDIQNALTLRYDDGRHAQLTSSLAASGPGSATISCSAGWLRTGGGDIPNPQELHVHGPDGARVETFDHVGAGYAYQLREVTRCIQQGLTESPTMPLADTLRTLELLDGVRTQLGLRYANDSRA
ncbi:Gfo/Idh/MocA family oxidoreductase [Arthrobacter sp. zg-Y820]|uniref:Gfo/Idh/MocA family protein n=1 Tax=unclassified Arthrobacter TaxID=235627 RepID=UPI001E3FB706|nr:MULTISPECIES: Gfo/Idh/MocA family oxidoreductase [unclassified Arthrobacter]MCC9196577.1 Gfo/Idh/MocA family oxidoreductase [Arthrobacter sp. zg-Y820]MDK1279439.1 Gfo/Idh/MocA family oxidoreductase [Arthrobacter sp. zg.Y820]WIB08181.1 Gfo/Idh/MocA family oxidoreductase [Arthrobacter sp. zg-Y820]